MSAKMLRGGNRAAEKLDALPLVLSLLGGLLFAWPAYTAPVTCTASDSPKLDTPQLPGCRPVPGKLNTWVIPAQWPDIPSENEPNGEQIMVLAFGAGSVILN